MWRQRDGHGAHEGGTERRRTFERYLNSLFARGIWTRSQIVGKLRAKGASEDEAESLAALCEQAGYVDDRAYALLFVDARPHWGRIRLRDELRRRGVSEDILREALEDLDEETAAAETAKEWFDGGVPPERIAGRLMRRGFSAGVVRNVLRRACEERD